MSHSDSATLFFYKLKGGILSSPVPPWVKCENIGWKERWVPLDGLITWSLLLWTKLWLDDPHTIECWLVQCVSPDDQGSLFGLLINTDDLGLHYRTNDRVRQVVWSCGQSRTASGLSFASVVNSWLSDFRPDSKSLWVSISSSVQCGVPYVGVTNVKCLGS